MTSKTELSTREYLAPVCTTFDITVERNILGGSGDGIPNIDSDNVNDESADWA